MDVLLNVAEACVQRYAADRMAIRLNNGLGENEVLTMLGTPIGTLAQRDGILDEQAGQGLAALLSRPLEQVLALADLIRQRSLDNAHLVARFPQHMKVMDGAGVDFGVVFGC